MKITRVLTLFAATLSLAATGCSGGTTPTDGGMIHSTSTTGGSGGSTTGGGGTTTGGGSTTGGSGGPRVGSACDVPSGNATDPCASVGLACQATNPNSNSPAGTCQLPTVYESCDPADAGCATGLSCLSDTTGGASCFQDCKGDPDCADPTTSCQSAGVGALQICNPNFCGPDIADAGYTSAGPTYYASCTIVDPNDGTCLPSPDPVLGTIGFCVASGSAVVGAPCTVNRADAGPSLCAIGLACVPDPNGGSGTACAPVCASVGLAGEFDGGAALDAGTIPDGGSADGGTADASAAPSAFDLVCATGATCLPAAGTDFGACAADCTPDAGPACPSGQSCLAMQLPDGGVLASCQP